MLLEFSFDLFHPLDNNEIYNWMFLLKSDTPSQCTIYLTLRIFMITPIQLHLLKNNLQQFWWLNSVTIFRCWRQNLHEGDIFGMLPDNYFETKTVLVVKQPNLSPKFQNCHQHISPLTPLIIIMVADMLSLTVVT